MEEYWLKRTEMLIGRKNIQKLEKSKIIIFGIGGVGSFVVEGLVRSGIGHIILVDKDTIDITNCNRQIHANTETIGLEKIEVMKQRILAINPAINVEIFKLQNLDIPEEELITEEITYVVDAVDTVTTKLKLIKKAKEINIPIISSMGTGNKLDPKSFEITDISKTSVCPLAKVMRKELKKLGIKQVKVLYSKEEPKKTDSKEFANQKKQPPGSIAFVPSVAGLIIASEIVNNIIK